MPSAFIDLVRDAGIVGAGGAGFPSHVKYDARVDVVIANGAECEPMLFCDQHVMANYASEIVKGLKMVVDATGAANGVIALKYKYYDAIDALNEALKNEPKLSLFKLGNFYPAGDEQVIVYEVTGKVVPEGGIPLNVGALVTNVSSLLNVYNAVKGENVTSRWITVNGCVIKPFTAKVPIGVSFSELIDLAGGSTEDDFVIISGGPMMGTLAALDSVVSKTTSGVLIFSSAHPHIKRITQSGDTILKRTKSSCDQCMACTDICPRYLLGHDLKPHMIMRSMSYGISDNDVVTSSFLCCDCGVCSYYACPLFLSPSKVNSFLKKSLGAAGVKNSHKRSEFESRDFRQGRLLPVSRLAERIGVAQYLKHEPEFFEISDDMFKSVKILLRQHIGVPSDPVVKYGDIVVKGQLLADIPPGKLGARVHASISGRVSEINGEYIIIQR